MLYIEYSLCLFFTVVSQIRSINRHNIISHYPVVSWDAYQANQFLFSYQVVFSAQIT